MPCVLHAWGVGGRECHTHVQHNSLQAAVVAHICRSLTRNSTTDRPTMHASHTPATDNLFRLLPCLPACLPPSHPAPARINSNSSSAGARRSFAARAQSSGSGGKRITQQEFTDKAWQAIVAAPEIASEYSQQIVETEHLLKALLEQPNGLARRVINKAGSDATRLLDKTDEFIRRQPRVSGDTAQQVRRRGGFSWGVVWEGRWEVAKDTTQQ